MRAVVGCCGSEVVILFGFCFDRKPLPWASAPGFHSCGVERSGVKPSGVECSGVQCSAVQCSAVQCKWDRVTATIKHFSMPLVYGTHRCRVCVHGHDQCTIVIRVCIL
eukprot:SAG31_NODE_482_length_15056_cov_5.057364_10_plen_108_part_00